MIFDIEMIRRHYEELPSRINAAKDLLGKQMTAAEKVLYAHLYKDEKLRKFERGVDYVDFARTGLLCRMQPPKWLCSNLCRQADLRLRFQGRFTATI